jgi:hypothetical protein
MGRLEDRSDIRALCNNFQDEVYSEYVVAFVAIGLVVFACFSSPMAVINEALDKGLHNLLFYHRSTTVGAPHSIVCELV